MQKRTSPVKFAHLTEKSGKGSISNLSTKALAPAPHAEDAEPPRPLRAGVRGLPLEHPLLRGAEDPLLPLPVFILNPSWNGFLLISTFFHVENSEASATLLAKWSN